jgi:hypothetical protein
MFGSKAKPYLSPHPWFSSVLAHWQDLDSHGGEGVVGTPSGGEKDTNGKAKKSTADVSTECEGL